MSNEIKELNNIDIKTVANSMQELVRAIREALKPIMETFQQFADLILRISAEKQMKIEIDNIWNNPSYRLIINVKIEDKKQGIHLRNIKRAAKKQGIHL